MVRVDMPNYRPDDLKTPFNDVKLNKSDYEAVLPVTQALPVIPESIIIFGEYSPELAKQIFISKVYTALWFQILFSSVFIALSNNNTQIQKFLLSNTGNIISLVDICLLLVSTCIFFNNEKMISNHSYKFISFYTILITYLLGYVGMMYKSTILLLSGFTTLTMFSGLTLYSIQTKYDYTTKGNYLLVCLLGLIMMGFMFPWIGLISGDEKEKINNIFNIVYSVGGTVLFSFYIVYDTQLIVGGKHRRIEFSSNDFALATISLYTDIINLFLFVLEIVGGSGR